jgi:hypothetical protein
VSNNGTFRCVGQAVDTDNRPIRQLDRVRDLPRPDDRRLDPLPVGGQARARTAPLPRPRRARRCAILVFSIVGDAVLLPALLCAGLPLTGLRKKPGPAPNRRLARQHQDARVPSSAVHPAGLLFRRASEWSG